MPVEDYRDPEKEIDSDWDDTEVRDPRFEEMYYGGSSKIFSSLYSPLDRLRNALEALGFHRYYGPGEEFKDEDFLEYYINKDESVMVRFSQMPAIIGCENGEKYSIQFEDLKSFAAHLKKQISEGG
jgi:hypothetical protein